ncbi:DotD/TraH family lipoprotein [Acidithiobacillus ferriphilus]|uniref:DotD/TraH family lipoprotein n=1 Tax=Acidithiobacillus ferriphilus TaxID=1689834 RepID=UPI00232ED547|nr:DotD/TraH family lipoprotein [Acidithiobacillus ferriphilus]WCE92820.1 DotD/TraH family lipoprotein [Acidithiobacillus ferriphilus]
MTTANISFLRTAGLLACLSPALLTGCARMHTSPVPANPAPSINGPLDRAADKVSNAWTLLATENAAIHPPKGGSPILPQALAKTVPLTWTGPVAPAVAKLSRLAGYQYIPQGKRPAAPIIVHLSGTHSLFRDLREIAVQAGKRADLTVNARTRKIVLRYTGAL